MGRDARRYDDHREALALLAVDGPLVAVVDAVGTERGWWHGRTWRREYARLDLAGGGPLVSLLFESPATGDLDQELCSVDVWTDRSAAEDAAGGAGAVGLPGAGWLTLRRFPDDDKLPGLPAVLATPGAPTVLRYRPGRRCTLRIDPAGGGPPVFVKVLGEDEDGAAMHREGEAVAAAAARGELGFAVARPVRWDPRTSSCWQGPVAGVPAVRVLLGPDGPPLAAAMGRAAATLTTSSLRPARRAGRSTQLNRSTKYARRIARDLPGLAGPLEVLLARLADLHRHDTDDRLRPIHGAPHPHQWLLDGERLGLVDFDGLALGPPELDVATFAAEVEYEDPARVPVAEVVSGFREGYEEVAGALDDRVLRAYLAHKRLAKAQRNSRAVRPDNDTRTAAAVQEALAATRD